MVYTIIQTPIPPDLQQAGNDIKDGIASRHIDGLAVIVSTKGRRFFVDVFGSLARDPHLARGLLGSLDDCLRDQVRGKRDTNTTLR